MTACSIETSWKELADVNVQSLQEYGFFTFPHTRQEGDRTLKLVDYFLEYSKANGMLTLHFTLPLKEPVPKERLKEFNFAVYDPTFYVAFAFADKDPIRREYGMTDCHA